MSRSNTRSRGAGALLASVSIAACLVSCAPMGAGGQTSTVEASTVATPTPAPTSTLRPEIRSSGLGDPVQAVAPQGLRITSLGVDMRVVPVGIAEAGQMELPEDPSVAGWYRFGPDAASATGSVVLAAHVDAVDHPIGPLANLRDAAAGETVIVTGVDGTERTYILESLTYYEKSDLPTDELFRRGGEPTLVLITCGGPFDSATGHYRDNVVAVARPQ